MPKGLDARIHQGSINAVQDEHRNHPHFAVLLLLSPTYEYGAANSNHARPEPISRYNPADTYMANAAISL
ncbi:hypothetical protein D3C80_1601310 [compost metagenome]